MLHLLFTLVATHQADVVGLDQLNLSTMTSGWQSPQKDRSVGGNPLKIGGRTFATGVGTHSRSDFTLLLNGHAKSFTTWVGLDDETLPSKGRADFRVIVDGKRAADSGWLQTGDAAKQLTVNLTGAHVMRLVVFSQYGRIDYAHSDWADATFQLIGSSVKLRPYAPPVEPTMHIADVDLVHTALHGPRVVGCTPGHEFLFRIPATGQGPLRWSVSGLPSGIGLERGLPVLRGTAPTAGTYHVRIVVRGPKGTAHRTLTIVSGLHKLALTPPMGWNSWNVWAGSVTADRVRAAADEFLSSHLAEFGYQYVNIDDTWEGPRDANGNITTNTKFGDMASLATYVHQKGLKLGIYSSPGPKTCAGFPASYQHELQDARSYAAWGIDYLKYDWCSYGGVPHPSGLAGFQLPYLVMREALDQVPRDIVYSLCQYGMGDVYKWGHSVVGGNLWRTTGDINDSWDSMSSIGFSHNKRSPYVKPGGWNDPDMLVVGKLGWGSHPRPTRLTGNEQITHITLWSLLAAPLIIGCDLTQLDRFTTDLLENSDVIDVDQDPLGHAATRYTRNGDLEVWARPMYDGSFAVGLFNRGPIHSKVSVNWSTLGLSAGPHRVRDLWQRRELGRRRGGFSAMVPSHGAVLIRVWK